MKMNTKATGMAGGLIAAALLAGCASGPTDPREDNLFSAIKGNTGGYDTYVEGQEQQLSGEQARGTNIAADQEQLRREKAAQDAELSALRADISALDSEVAALQAEAMRAKSEAGANQADVARATARLEEVRAEIVGLKFKADQSGADAAALQAERDALAAEMEQMEALLDTGTM